MTVFSRTKLLLTSWKCWGAVLRSSPSTTGNSVPLIWTISGGANHYMYRCRCGRLSDKDSYIGYALQAGPTLIQVGKVFIAESPLFEIRTKDKPILLIPTRKRMKSFQSLRENTPYCVQKDLAKMIPIWCGRPPWIRKREGLYSGSWRYKENRGVFWPFPWG